MIILKIIGIALLAVLILAVCLVVMALFVPLRYRIQACFGEENSKRDEEKSACVVSVKAKWLLGIVSAEYIYPSDDGGIIRLFFIPLRKRRKKTKGSKKSEKSKKPAKKEAQVKKPEKKDGQKKAPGPKAERIPQAEPGYEEEPVKPAKKRKRIPDIKEKIRSFKDRSRKTKAYYGVLSKPENKGAYRFVKKTLFSLIKHSAPKKVYADMIIGLEDPCNTGFLFGALGLVISFVKGKYNLVPDFYNKRLDGRIYVKGKIRSVVVIYHLVKVITNSDIKKVTGQFKTIR